MTNFSRIVNSTINKYIRKEMVNIFRRRKLLGMLKSKGRVTYGHSGLQLDWKVRYRQAPLNDYADAETLSFQRRNKRQTAQLPWRAYAQTDSITKYEKLANRNQEAIIKIYSNLAKELIEDMEDNFCSQLYVDGNASGNTRKIHGLESWFSTSAASANEPIGLANDTYAGLVCTLGNYGGSWTGNWPSGTGDTQYDFWTPLVVDYTSAVSGAFTASTKTWPNTCVEAIRYGIMHVEKNAKMCDIVLLEKGLYQDLLNFLDDKERIAVLRNGGGKTDVSVGFGTEQHVDGTPVTWEYDVPADVGYGLCLDELELCSMQKQLFMADEDQDISTQTDRFAVDFYGNLKANPRHTFKLEAIS